MQRPRERAGPIEILSVEDNPADAELLSFLFSQCASHCRLTFMADGLEASDYLFQRGKHALRPLPDLILLDLNIPKKDSRSLLQEIKADAELRAIPVIVLTSSNSETDIKDSYALGANAFLSKPLELDRFDHLIRSIEKFWLTVVDLPGQCPGARKGPSKKRAFNGLN